MRSFDILIKVNKPTPLKSTVFNWKYFQNSLFSLMGVNNEMMWINMKVGNSRNPLSGKSCFWASKFWEHWQQLNFVENYLLLWSNAFWPTAVVPILLYKSCSNQKINATLFSNFKSFSNKISRIFLFEQLYVRPLLAILKGQYRPWARRGRLVRGWYGQNPS